MKSEYDVIVVSSSHKVIPIISSLLGHKVTVKGEEGYDKLFIWKNGEFYKQYNQGEFIGKEKKVPNSRGREFDYKRKTGERTSVAVWRWAQWT